MSQFAFWLGRIANRPSEVRKTVRLLNMGSRIGQIWFEFRYTTGLMRASTRIDEIKRTFKNDMTVVRRDTVFSDRGKAPSDVMNKSSMRAAYRH